MSAARPQFSIDDAFELSLEDAGPGPESSGVARFGPLHFERRARFEVADEDKQSRLRYQNLENDEDGAQASPEPDGGASTRDSGRTSIRSSQWSFSNISTSTQRSYNACCSWTQHPLIQKNHRVVLASFLLLLLGLGPTDPAKLLKPGLLPLLSRQKLEVPRKLQVPSSLWAFARLFPPSGILLSLSACAMPIAKPPESDHLHLLNAVLGKLLPLSVSQFPLL
ncbi:transmembrane protein 134 isoform X5 [Balaenoptera ricei]|nr:transmembrane protein 134 isoform X5 [Balaenoptera ricei]